LRDQVSRGTPGGSSTLGGARAPAGPADGDVTASLLDRVSRLEDSVRALTGRLDELANAQQRMNDDLTKQIEDLNFKLGNGGVAPLAPAAPAAPGAPPAVAKPGALPPIPAVTAPAAAIKRTPEVALQEGNAALARRDYATAEAAAREVIAVPKSPRAYDGQFLLAQALVGKKDYQGAAIAYDDTYNHARTGAHAPDSLLGLANALTAIGEKRAACATLDKLHTEFPNLRPDLKDPNAAARQHAGCH
jgi:TolA-binding protein